MTTEKTVNQKSNEGARPAFKEIYMNFAKFIARRSTCGRLQVGTVITSTDFRKVLAIGYNGNAAGFPNCCDREEVGNCGCIHSEENAIINCDSPRYVEKIMFVTHLPCVQCTKKIINLGNVKTVYFNEFYRSDESLEYFEKAGINIEKITSKE